MPPETLRLPVEGPALIVRGDTQIVIGAGCARAACEGRRPDPAEARGLRRPQARMGGDGEAGRSGHPRTVQSPPSWAWPRPWARRWSERPIRSTSRNSLDFSCALFDADGGLVANAPATCAGPPGFDGRERAGGARATCRTGARRRLRAQQPLRGRDASARHHPGHAGLRRLRDTAAVLCRGARPSRRRRRRPAGFDAALLQDHRRGGRAAGRPARDAPTGAFLEARGARTSSPSAHAPGAQPEPEPRRSQGADRGLPGRRRGGARDDRHSRRGDGGPLHGSCAGQRRSLGAPGYRPG